MPKNIYIVRHCEAQGQPPESQLTEKGHEQAIELARFFSNTPIASYPVPFYVPSSPLSH